MPRATGHPWRFKARFRRHAFGWRSQPAIMRLVEAVSEIKQVARVDPVVGADGAVMLLERISPALENVDSSSGAIGSAVNRTIAELVPVIASAPADTAKRVAVLADLVQHTPGDEGKWFAAAKDGKLFDEAIALANATPCDPKTLTRAARDFARANPVFALEAGLAALRWLVGGYGYEITSLDVRAAYAHTLTAATNAGVREATEQRIRSLFNHPTARTGFVADVIGRELGLR